MKVTKQFKDEDLLRLIRSGEKKDEDRAFHFIYKTMYAGIRHFIRQHGGGDDDALDVFQDAAVVFHDHVQQDRFKGASSVKTYVFSIAKNLWYQELRKSKRSEARPEEELTVLGGSFQEDAELIRSTRLMEKLLEKLDRDCKSILQMYYYSRLSMKEIQESFDLGSEQAAKNKKARCLKKLIELVNTHKLSIEHFNPGHE